jgi:glycosyltransferase involved in cell wall biosynthesis
LILTNDPIALSLLPILIFYKLFKRGEIIVVIMGLFSKPKPNKLINLFQSLFIRTLLLVSSKFIFLGKNEKLNAENLYLNKKNKLSYLPFCVDTNFWYQEKVEKVYDFIFVGNDGNRDYKFLIEMVEHLQNYKFLVISNNYQLTEYFENNIVLNGDFYKGSMSESKITDAELRTFYNQAKVSLVPLNNTVQPSGQSVSLQSLSVGIPVIISDTDGNWFNGEKISSDFIYTAKQNTIESWNHLFENIYQESNDYEKISKRMSGYIKDNLDKSVFDLNLKKIILDILDQN